MKRQRGPPASREKFKPTPPFPHPLEFFLLDPLDSPPEAAPPGGDEDRSSFGGWYRGRVRIVSCPRERTLEGLSVNAIICGRLPARASYWIYQCAKGVLLDVDAVRVGNGTMVIPKEASVCMPTRLKPMLEKSDLLNLLDECTPHFSLALPQQMVARQLIETNAKRAVSSALMQWQLQFPWIVEHSQLTRAPIMGTLFDAFLRPYMGRDAQKQRHILGALPLETLRLLATDLQQKPWELLWTRTMKRIYGGVKGLPDLPDTCSLVKLPTLEQAAVRILKSLREASKNAAHTLFSPGIFKGCIPCLPMDYRARFEPQLLQYLQDRDLMFVAPPGRAEAGLNDSVVLYSDFQNAQGILRNLAYIKQRASHEGRPLHIREPDAVPCIPPQLTQDQLAIARHITQNWLTIVLGSPGTGKTALLTWVLSHYKCALATGFVGRLVKMLHKRNGRRPEMAYTMDSLLYTVLKSGAGDIARKWLAHFEVLVIDECSNVSMGHIMKLLPIFSNLRKLVLVGDTHQLPSLKPGDFLADMATHFPLHTFRLTQNLRVAPDLVTLQEAPQHILHGRPENIEWTGPMSILPLGESAEETLRQLYSSILYNGGERARSLMNVQVLSLTNKGPHGRANLNHAFHNAAERLGILRPQGNGITINDRLRGVYPGCKLTCLKNYNHPIVKEFGPLPEMRCASDPVANGEIFIVHRIWKPRPPARGVCMEVFDTKPEDAIKRIWVDEDEGVSPWDLDWGYATTVYKSQGGEFPWVIFCVPPTPAPHWTRANAYVAVSRAQQSCIVLGAQNDFNAICKRDNLVRRTIFGHLLQHDERYASLTEHEALSAACLSEEELEIILDPENECSLLDEDTLAVPTLKEFMPKPQNERLE
jgi:hypothetical protein